MSVPARAYLSIGEVLTKLRGDFPDITISKIRFLESEGLIDPQRTPSGYRKFTGTDLERLRYVLLAQRDQYLPLRVIKENLDALDRGLQPAPTSWLPLQYWTESRASVHLTASFFHFSLPVSSNRYQRLPAKKPLVQSHLFVVTISPFLEIVRGKRERSLEVFKISSYRLVIREIFSAVKTGSFLHEVSDAARIANGNKMRMYFILTFF